MLNLIIIFSYSINKLNSQHLSCNSFMLYPGNVRFLSGMSTGKDSLDETATYLFIFNSILANALTIYAQEMFNRGTWNFSSHFSARRVRDDDFFQRVTQTNIIQRDL